MVELGKFIELTDKLDKERTELGYNTQLEMIIELCKRLKLLEERIIKLEGEKTG